MSRAIDVQFRKERLRIGQRVSVLKNRTVKLKIYSRKASKERKYTQHRDMKIHTYTYSNMLCLITEGLQLVKKYITRYM